MIVKAKSSLIETSHNWIISHKHCTEWCI